MLQKLVRNGRLVVTDHDGSVHEYGTGPGDPIRLRLTNRKAANHIARYPQVGAGEAYMWGWLEVEEPHDIRDLVLFATATDKGKDSADFKAKGPLRKFGQMALARFDSYN
ncbi:MAG: SAM-dependent methyltransferase, partial [Novosphingobium sp.]|nr:SAM-dependent methyltransferase [Novosphingobium sp.]